MAKQIKYGEDARRSLERVSMPWLIPSKLPWDRRAATSFWTRSTALPSSRMTA